MNNEGQLRLAYSTGTTFTRKMLNDFLKQMRNHTDRKILSDRAQEFKLRSGIFCRGLFPKRHWELWHQAPCPELGRNLHTASSPYAAITLDRAEGQEGPLGRLSKRPSPKCSLTKGTRPSWARRKVDPKCPKWTSHLRRCHHTSRKEKQDAK